MGMDGACWYKNDIASIDYLFMEECFQGNVLYGLFDSILIGGILKP